MYRTTNSIDVLWASINHVTMVGIHPCLSCGACCAFFRVAFYWREAEKSDQQNAVPQELTVDLDLRFRCMKGTEKKHNPCCVALRGRIGTKAECSIYEQRPTTCRNFAASFGDGIKNPRCDEAREAHGLKPLSPIDWINYDSELRWL